MSTKHGMVIRLIEEALGGPDGRAFAKMLLQMLELRFEEGLKRIRNDEEIEAIFETQRAIGAVDALVEVVGKLERISRRYAEVDERELSEAFARFSARLATVAEKRATPIMARAAQIRAERVQGTN
jgi:hypothetical protein